MNKSKKINCPFCKSKKVNLKSEKYNTGRKDKYNIEIFIDTKTLHCNSCNHSWMTVEESERIDDLVINIFLKK